VPFGPDNPTWKKVYGALAVPAVGCGGRVGLNTDGADAVVEAEATIDAPPPARTCTTDDDCIAVLDHRDGFSCHLPSAASKVDVGRNPCLIPWKPNAVCTTPAPPAGCPYSDPIPVQHSCFNIPCALPTCNEGTCVTTYGFGSECPVVDAGLPDCATLLATYDQAITAGQECDPTQDASSCGGEYPDSCGCEAPYNLTGRQSERAAVSINHVAARCGLGQGTRRSLTANARTGSCRRSRAPCGRG
jgi:hypothetical protein